MGDGGGLDLGGGGVDDVCISVLRRENDSVHGMTDRKSRVVRKLWRDVACHVRCVHASVNGSFCSVLA